MEKALRGGSNGHRRYLGQSVARWTAHREGWDGRHKRVVLAPSNDAGLGVAFSESCQLGRAEGPAFSKAALVSTAGEVHKLQHLDFSCGAVGAPNRSRMNFEERENHETSSPKTISPSGSGRRRPSCCVADCKGGRLSDAARALDRAAPGGSYDIIARVIGQWLSERLGQQFIIENRPGAEVI